MSAFQTVADPAAPVRIVLVGAGLMGRAWMRTIDEYPDAELVGVSLSIDDHQGWYIPIRTASLFGDGGVKVSATLSSIS